MRGLLRKMRIGVTVLATVVLGGGFATAAGNAPDSTDHDVSYEIMSFRAIALDNANLDAEGAVAFGNVRQGHSATVQGPNLRYATTWAGDHIVVSIGSNVDTGIELRMWADNLTGPTAAEPAMTSAGGPECEGTPGTPNTTVVLTSDVTSLINSITDCGIDTAGYWASAETYFTVDATLANDADEDYSGPQVKTVTYTIDAAA